MFQGTSYFQTYPCPYYASGRCDRPYCHFKHIKPDKPEYDSEVAETEYAINHPGYSTAPKPAQPAAAPFSVAAAVSGSSHVASDGSSQVAIDGSSTAATSQTALINTTTSLPAVAAASIATPSVSAASTAAIAAAMGPLAALSSVLEKDKLEEMIQNAVRKVLLETAGAASNIQAIPQTPKVEVKEEADDDIFIEYCDVKPNTSSQFKSESVTQTTNFCSAEMRSTTPKLFIPSSNTPQYIPTPIKELEKRGIYGEEESIQQSEGDLEEDNAGDVQTQEDEISQEKDQQPGNSALPISLQQSKSSVTAKKAGKKTYSYKPPPKPSDNILGDIDDMSESNDEEETPDLVGSILKAGSSSGILTSGDKNALEEEIIKEKCKILKKKLDKEKEDSSKDKDSSEDDGIDQDNKVTSSSHAKKLAEESESVSEDVDNDKTIDLSDDSTEEDDEDRKIREEQEAIENLEKKRLMLENFYKSRMKKLQDAEALKESAKKKDDSKKHVDKEKKSDKKDDSKQHKTKSSESSSRRKESDRRSSKHKHRSRSRDKKHSSRSKDRKHRSRSKEKKHRSRSKESKQRSRQKHKSSRDESSSESRSPEKRKHHKRPRSKNSKHERKRDKRSRKSSSEYSSDYDSDISETGTDEPKSKSKRDNTKDKNKSFEAEPKDQIIVMDAMDDIGIDMIADDNLEGEYEEQPVPGTPADEFKLAELKIKQLLEEKMKAPTLGKYSTVKLDIVKPDVKKIEIKEYEHKEDIPDVNIFLKPKPSPKKEVQVTVKPEIKLRPMTDLTGSQSPIDPKTQNIFDHDQEESFLEMIKRNQSGWLNVADPELAANTSYDSIAAPEEDDLVEDEPSEDNPGSFLDAINANDKAAKEKKDESNKRDRSSSDNRSKEHKKYKDGQKSDKESHKSDRDRHRSKDDRRKSKKDDKDKDRHRHSSHSTSSHSTSSHSKDKHKKTSSRDRHHRNDKSSEKGKEKRDKDPGTPSQVPDTTVDTMDIDDIPDFTQELDDLPDLDADMDAMFNSEEEGAGDDELQRLFNEYKPDERRSDPSRAKLLKQISSSSSGASSKPGQSSSSKKRVAHDGATEHGESRRPLHMRKPQSKTPAQAMLDRYKRIQQMTKHNEMEKELEEMTSDEPQPSSSSSTPAAGGSKRTAHQQKPVVLSKTRQQLLGRQASTTSSYDLESGTAAQTAKGKSRVAHTPTPAAAAAIARPMVTLDSRSSKVPTNVRQRYLDSIIEECLKIYNKDESKAYPRAEKEEQDCCRKANNNRMIYLNLVVNKIKKLRTEAEEAKTARVSSGGQGRLGVNMDTGKRSMLTTHLQVLAGKGGTIGTWSIEKPVKLTDEDIDEELMYNVMKKFILTEEQLVANCFPRPDPEEVGKAIVKVNPSQTASFKSSDPLTRRICVRCKTEYRVNEDGKQIDKEDCVYHWGRQHRQRGNRALGGSQTVFYCCQMSADSSGCVVGKAHVTESLDYNNMHGFVSTLPRLPGRSNTTAGRVFALDCEMCYTTQGNELTRVTVIDQAGEVIYESLVKPDNEIVDYNTRFSGITEADLKDVSTNITQVQAVLLMKFDAKDILIGHSLESDLKALKILHGTVVDTSVVFPHRMGPPFKRALKFLAADHLKRIIQSDEGGHDSKEDALTCLDLMKMKVKEEVKRLQKKARIQAMYEGGPPEV